MQLGRRLAHRERQQDKTVRVWDVATKECVATLEGHTNSVNAVCGLGDGSRIASGSSDKTVRVWDVATKECVATLEGHTNYVWAVCGLGDGRASRAAADKTVRVWDVATKECVATLEGHTEPPEGGVQLGRRLAHRERQQGQDGARVGCGDKGVRGHA